MNVGTETPYQPYIDDFQLLRFVQKQCLRMVESNTTKVHGVWIGLCLAALHGHPDLELQFRQLWVNNREIPGEQPLPETSDILQSAINRVQESDQMDIELSPLDAQGDLIEDSTITEPSESLAKVGRWFLFYLRQEAKHMLEKIDYECLPMWEHLLRISLSLVCGTREIGATPCLELSPDEKLGVGMDVIRDVLFRREPRQNPWV